ncbi:hypothetical protein BKA67DRAFT_573893 [Truncatella angustata]|uniref:F-box domain-containing protein n=1 Tax=Truncatella angustata TaxID=152316 RepID=A0A9P8UHQ8_9PEZI|nr:uncharacterized protein BKA67DRAFT_573893 [Truncatella angustata]KAH6652405.1 hypothetical protein BKA67DRAFT_573893 [Truncatella angustata]
MDSLEYTQHDTIGCNSLPLEVWIEILGYLIDKDHLSTTWLSCRRVSHLLKSAAEKAYTYDCIRRWKVHLLLGYRKLGPRANSTTERWTTATTLLKFTKLSPDGERIYFEDAGLGAPRWGVDQLGGDLHLVARCLRSGTMELIIGSGAYSVGTIDAMLDIKEGDLPSIELDVNRETRIVSYQWRPLLSTFLENAHDGNPRAFYGTYGKTKPGRIVRGV